MTYWLYFAHFFFFTTLAIRSGRTSFWSLYLWGVLYGLYESWITKVIWSGYNGDGTFAMGRIGPYGLSELSMVLIFHPLMSFIIPLAVTCLLCPPLRRLFPELAWLTGKSKTARIVQGYLILSFAPVMAMNSGGAVNLAANLTVAIAGLLLLLRWACPALACDDGRTILVFGRAGFAGVVVYLLALYIVAYFCLRPASLPSIPVQLATIAFYATAVVGLCLQQRRQPLPANATHVDKRELRLVMALFAAMAVSALVLALAWPNPVIMVVNALNFIFWIILGALLAAASLVSGLLGIGRAR